MRAVVELVLLHSLTACDTLPEYISSRILFMNPTSVDVDLLITMKRSTKINMAIPIRMASGIINQPPANIRSPKPTLSGALTAISEEVCINVENISLFFS